ncbi:metallophosphoesterase family protein [Haloarchaeobius sp. FL176]|uniref:metallophosphoesterase family protein n=1 Tax=Haloarchaeobius sp. FL176 TaxID=2967129 RepID=UPI0021475D1E|nr:metallophosphoesterase family protein [Haloarchaeobius sp. FL176]
MRTPAPAFPETEAAWHRTVDRDEWDDIYVVGDVHGCLSALDRLLATLDPSADDLVVFVGDLVKKGPNSRGVLRRVRDAPNMLSVRGNNEEKLLRGDASIPELGPVDLEYVRSMPVAISWDDHLVVHGGVDHRKTLADHSVDDVQNMRALDPADGYDGPFWFAERDEGPRVFFGHTVLESPVYREYAVGLDTGCVYGGELTAYDVAGDEFVSVPLARSGRDRSASKIVTPERTQTV